MFSRSRLRKDMPKHGRDAEKKNDEAVHLSDGTAYVTQPVSRRDALLGRIVIIVFLVLAAAATAFFSYLAYRITLTGVSERESIGSIGTGRSSAEESDGQAVPEVEADAGQSVVTPVPADIAVLVLNGGAPKGSAAAVAQALVKAGYSKAEAGNADGDYTGTAIYHAPGKESEAESVKRALPAAQVAATVRVADSQRPETSRAPVIVILGR